jgi:hypothetical protein
MAAMTDNLGAAFARAMAEKDHAALRSLLHEEIDFRAMTPGRVWEAAGPDDVVAAAGMWFEPDDHVEAVEAVETGQFADRERVGYRFRVRNAEGLHVVEQQAYLSERDGRIGWLRVMCSGYRPVAG